jgi:hypothetical protein
MYVSRDIQERSPNHCHIGKTISITYSECLSVALVIQHAARMRHIVICGLPGCTYFFPTYFINGTIFGRKKKSYLNIKCVLIFSTTFV